MAHTMVFQLTDCNLAAFTASFGKNETAAKALRNDMLIAKPSSLTYS